MWETRMRSHPRAAVERMMKVQEVILRAMAKKITWWQAAEVIGMSDRQMPRFHWRYREQGHNGLLNRRVGKSLLLTTPNTGPLAFKERLHKSAAARMTRRSEPSAPQKRQCPAQRHLGCIRV